MSTEHSSFKRSLEDNNLLQSSSVLIVNSIGGLHYNPCKNISFMNVCFISLCYGFISDLSHFSYWATQTHSYEWRELWTVTMDMIATSSDRSSDRRPNLTKEASCRRRAYIPQLCWPFSPYFLTLFPCIYICLLFKYIQYYR